MAACPLCAAKYPQPHTREDWQQFNERNSVTTTANEKMSAAKASEEVLEEGQHGLYVLDGSGDSRFMWSKDNPDEITAAKKQFKSLKDKGYLAYKVQADGSKGERISEFDPTAEKIIMAPQLVGG